MDEAKVSELSDIFRDLADTAGGYERTRIMPNLEVIDTAPSGLPANFIIIKDDEGFYIPALKVAGMTYTNGDLVNVLFIKGAEPVAFQHGSSGSGGYAVHISDEGVDQGNASTLDFVGAGVTAAVAAGAATITISAGGGGWPAAGKAMINNVEYDTVQLAIDAMASGDIIKVGQGTDSGGIVPDTAGSIVGLSPVETIITRSDNSSITVSIDTPDNVALKNLTISHTGAGTSVSCVQTNQDGIVLDGLNIEKTSGTPTNATGVSVYGGSGAGTYLRNCKITISTGTNKYGVYTSTAANNVIIEGGEINAVTTDIYIGHASSVVELRGVKLLGGGINNASGGTVKGWYYDTNNNVKFVGTTTIQMATGAAINEFSTDGTLGGDSDTALPTEKAVKAYVDGKLGTWTTWTPTVTQSGSVTVTVNFAKYKIIDKVCFVSVRLTVTGSGTSGNDITIGGQPAAMQSVNTGAEAIIGYGLVKRNGITFRVGDVVATGATSWKFIVDNDAYYLGSGGSAFGLAANDTININACYEVA